jgi:hypothetical protein
MRATRSLMSARIFGSCFERATSTDVLCNSARRVAAAAGIAQERAPTAITAFETDFKGRGSEALEPRFDGIEAGL